jgi:hypothetical protein
LELQNYPDPYLEAFWGKGIKNMIAYDPYDSIQEDSLRMERLFFDKAGNIARRTAFMVNDTLVYDSRRYIIRQVEKLDAPKNFVVSYHFVNGNLIQIWSDLRHRNWEYSDEDMQQAGKDCVKFELNKEGRIVKRYYSNETTVYTYSKDKLIRQETYVSNSENDNEPLSVTLYKYSNQRIERIDDYRRGQLSYTHYYFNGLLDSTVHVFDGENSVTKYRYVFFNRR